MQAQAAVRRRRFSKTEVYRYFRLIHGWLSAVAFLVLCFFSFTGLLLNHPEWIESDPPDPINHRLTLTPAELESIDTAEDPIEALATLADAKVAVRGEVTGGDYAGDELFVRMQGVRGLTDLRLHTITGSLEVVIEPAPTLLVLNELHRAERAGNTWRWFVDVTAIVLIVLSLVGYLIFLSMRLRLRTALLLTVTSGAAIYVLFLIGVR